MGGGLNRFNPQTHQFEAFKHQKNSAESIRANRVSALYEDSDGSIWTGLWQGVGFNHFDPELKKFTRFALDSNSLKSDWYSGFETIGNDTLVAGFWGAEGIRLFHKQKKEWLPHSFRPANHPINGSIHHIETTDSLIWLYQKGNILNAFKPFTRSFEAYRSQKFTTINNRLQINSVNLPVFSKIYDIFKTRKSTLFLTDKGLVSFQNKNFKTINAKVFKLAFSTDRTHNLLLLADDGIWTYAPQTEQFSNIFSAASLPVTPTNITDGMVLTNNRLLLGTSTGLILLDLYNGSRIPLPAKFSSINLPTQAVRKTFRIKDAILLIYPRDIAYIPESGDAKIFNTQNSFDKGMRNNAINFSLPSINGDDVWLGANRGLYLFTPSTGKFRLIPELNNCAVYEMGYFNKQLYLGTDQGLANLAPQSGKVTYLNKPPDDMLSSHLTTFVKKDRKGFIWTGTTNKGLNRIDPRSLKVNHYFNENGFHGTEVLAFLETATGDIYAGGDSLNIYNPSKDLFERPTFANLLPKEKIVSLTEDPMEQIIIVTTHNILIYAPDSERLFNMTPYLGSKNITFTSASLKTSFNEIYIGTVKGFFRLDPALFNPPENPKDTRITKISIMGDPVLWPRQNKLILSHDQNWLQISFSDMVFPPDHDQFFYKLDNTDQEWIKTDQTSVIYKLLPPGDYNFRVKTYNPFGASHESTLQITITPPFWKTWWFITFLMASIATGFWLWWRHRLHHIQVLENNLNLRHRLLLSQMNPHFMFNALSAIQSFIYQNQPQTAGRYLSKFAKLMRLYLNNMATTVTPISDETATLTHYLELQQLRFNGTFKYSVKVFPEQAPLSVAIPAMVVQPFVENAVEHGIQDIKQKGNIEVIYSLKNNSCHVIIRDNGIGIEQSRIRKSKSLSTHQSMSMEITRKRIEQLTKQYKHPCQLTIKDRTQEPGSQTGTEVSLTVPAIHLPGNKNDQPHESSNYRR
jgi:ligand-binding sensor domain-containing protein/two-component sensor histidine kinase